MPSHFFQGTEDVSSQSIGSHGQALREKNIPVAYVLFEGEGHGFRQAANVRRLENELSFYAQVFDFSRGEIEPVEMKTSRSAERIT